MASLNTNKHKIEKSIRKIFQIHYSELSFFIKRKYKFGY